MKKSGMRAFLILMVAAAALALFAAVSSGSRESSGFVGFTFYNGDTSLQDDTPEDADGSPKDARFIEDPTRESDYYIVVFLKSQLTVVYGKDSSGGYIVPVKCFVCSTGAGNSTRTGLYKIYRRYRWRALVGGVYGQYATGFSDSYLFHSVPYAQQDPSTLDMEGYDALGEQASHGCVRLCVRDSKWIYENCPDGTQVNIVNKSCSIEGEPVPPVISDSDCAGWDPSDPDESNPYLSR